MCHGVNLVAAMAMACVYFHVVYYIYEDKGVLNVPFQITIYLLTYYSIIISHMFH